MIDAMYNYRQGEIHSTEFSNAFNALCIPFENSLSEEQIDIFHQILDCVSDTAAAAEQIQLDAVGRGAVLNGVR